MRESRPRPHLSLEVCAKVTLRQWGGSPASVAPNVRPAGAAANRLGPVGVGLFTLPNSLENDYDGTLASLFRS